MKSMLLGVIVFSFSVFAATLKKSTFLQESGISEEMVEFNSVFDGIYSDADGTYYQTYDQTLGLISGFEGIRSEMEDGDIVNLQGLVYSVSHIHEIIGSLSSVAESAQNVDTILVLDKDHNVSFITMDEYNQLISN